MGVAFSQNASNDYSCSVSGSQLTHSLRDDENLKIFRAMGSKLAEFVKERNGNVEVSRVLQGKIQEFGRECEIFPWRMDGVTGQPGLRKTRNVHGTCVDVEAQEHVKRETARVNRPYREILTGVTRLGANWVST